MRILKFTSSLLLLLLVLNGNSLSAQEPGMRDRGLRIGVDVANLALLYFEPERRIYTFSADYEILQDIYPVLEFGLQTVDKQEETFSYSSGGGFARTGVDVNLLKYERTDVYEMLYAGFRYGFSSLSHQADDIGIAGAYFGETSGGSVARNQLNAHFISVVGGIRVELFRNFFMGWSVLANLKLAGTKDPNMRPYNIPGFGPGNRKTAVAINYTFSYRIPLQTYKPVKIIKKKELPPEEEE